MQGQRAVAGAIAGKQTAGVVVGAHRGDSDDVAV